MKYLLTLALLACPLLLGSCGLTRRLDRIGCGAPRHIPESRLLLFGGDAGSVEDPAFVGKVTCFRASEAPTALGLEIPVSEQGAINGYLASGGGAASRAKLLSMVFWKTDKDGRASASMFRLLDDARRMQQEGMPLTVFAFSEDKPDMTYDRSRWRSEQSTTLRLGSVPNLSYDAFMAKEIRRFHTQHPKLRIVALMGYSHAGLAPIWIGSGQTITSAGYLLRDLKPTVIALQHHSGYLQHPLGTEWSCSLDFCGVHQVSNIYAWIDARQPGFYHDTTIEGYSTTYVLPSLTASPPAVDVWRR